MITVNSYSMAIIMLFITMLCWGSWANFEKKTDKSWSFHLFYIDYTFGILLTLLFFALTFGSLGHVGRSFLPDLFQANFFSFFNSFLSGFIWSFGTLLLVAAISIAGMSVAFPIGIGIALLLGVTTNYLKEPVGDGKILAIGVLFLLVAIILDSIAYSRKADKNLDRGGMKGICISVLAGCILGFVIRLMMNAISFDFHNPEIGKMTPYTASVIFALGAFISNFFGNYFLMKSTILGPAVSIRSYLLPNQKKNHSLGLIAGLVWSIGWIFNMLSAGVAGFAISDALGQGATMVAALWGVLVWKEFKNVDKKTTKIVVLMFVMYISGLFAIIYSRYH